MPDNILITPYFLDEYFPELETLPFSSTTLKANGNLAHLFHVPCLSSGLQYPGIRSGLMQKTGVIRL